MSNKFEKVKAFYFSLWPGLKDENWQDLETRFTVRQYNKGDHLLKPGEVCDSICFINYGLVRSYYEVQGKEICVNFFTEGSSCCNYHSFLPGTPSLMHLDALEDTEVVAMHYDTLQYAYKNLPDSERVGRLMAEQLFIMLSNRTVSFLLETPEQRYLNFLKTRYHSLQRVPQYMIASYLGITPEALSRIRGRLSKKGHDTNPDIQ